MYGHCSRCRRPVKEENLVTVEGRKFGPTCATKVGDLLVQPQRRALISGRSRTAKKDSRQSALFTEPTP